MNETVPLFPERASAVAWQVDRLYFFLVICTVALALLLAVLVITFAIRYRRRAPDEIGAWHGSSNLVEFGWTGATLALFLVMYFWGAHVYFDVVAPPPNAMDIFVVGKQWMWQLQHPEGQREINELHIPVGTPVRLTMTSQDVIHSFYVPAFRTKQDVIPGRYVTMWFNANKVGKYHLFCAEFCGAKHSGMIGWVYAMTPADYAAWLTTGGAEGSLASRGEKLYHQYGCSTCHDLEGKGQGPSFRGVYESSVRLDGGGSVVADENYLRESILQADAKVVLGYKPIMPTFQGQLSEDQVLALIEFIKAMRAPVIPSSPSAAGATPIQGSVPEKR